jgi:hypothetical protein
MHRLCLGHIQVHIQAHLQVHIQMHTQICMVHSVVAAVTYQAVLAVARSSCHLEIGDLGHTGTVVAPHAAVGEEVGWSSDLEMLDQR